MLPKKPKNASFLHPNKNRSKDLNPIVFKIYAGSNSSQRNRKNTSKSKRKPKNNKLQRQDSATYDFPQFSISFTEHLRKPRPECIPSQQRIPICIDHKQPSPPKQQQLYKQDLQQQLKKQYYPDFILALAKLYKSLDLFNRGTITELNINNRIHPAALTFCSTVFKKIKEDRLTLNERQFIKLCEPLLKNKDIDELVGFIRVFSPQEENLKVSIDFNETKKEMSPIKKRMVEEHINSNRKNNRLEEVLGAISDKEKEINEKIKDVKERKKTVSFNIQGETSSHNVKETSDKIANSIVQSREKSPSLPNPQINKIFLNPSKQNHQDYFIPQLAYKLPPNPSARRRADSKNILTTTNPNIPSHHNQSSINHSNYRQSSIDSRRCQQYLDDDQKISELTSRIEQYLKRSQSKIQKSKVFMMENSLLLHR